MRIGLFGLFGCGNSGNDASLEAMVVFLRRAGLGEHLLCICPNPDRIQRVYGLDSTYIAPKYGDSTIGRAIDRLLLRVPRRLFAIWYTIQKVRKLDVIIVPGTGFLDDFQDNPFGWPFMVLKWCLAAWLMRKKIVFVSIGAGPIRHWLSRFFMKKAAQTATYRSYRDTISKNFMHGMGVNANEDNVYPDIVFGLPKPTPLSSDGHSFTVGLGVMSYYGWSRANANRDTIYRHYLRKLNAFVTWLLDRGIHVRLLTGDEGDWAAIQDFIEEMNTSNLLPALVTQLTAVRTYTLQDLMTEINKTDVVVVTRYHNLVCALKLGRPAVSLEYSKKNHALMAEIDLDEYCQNVETFDLDLLKQQFVRMVDNQVNLQGRILAADEDFIRRLSIQESALLDFFSDNLALSPNAEMPVAG